MKTMTVILGLAAVVVAAQADVSIDWCEGTPMPLGTYYAASGVVDGRIHVIGGFPPCVNHWAYDIEADSWIIGLAPMPNPSTDSRAVVYDGELYVLGGYWPQNAMMRKYNPALDTWFILSSPPSRTVTYGYGAAAVGDRIYYYYGCWDDALTSNEVWEYDPACDSWTQKAPAPGLPRAYVASASDGEYCYSVGGDANDDWRAVYRYHPPTDSWERLDDYPVSVYFADGDFLKDHLFIAGGGDGFLFPYIPSIDDVHYWTEAGGWDSTDFLPGPMGIPQVVLLTHNDTDYIYVLGGAQDQVLLNTVYVGVITGLEPAITEAAPARRPERVSISTMVRGSLQLPEGTKAVLMDANGRDVAELQPGLNDIRHIRSGIYFLRSAVGGKRSAVSKVVVTR
jgi:hypothetical protein